MLCGDRQGLKPGVEVGFGLGGWDVADEMKEPAVVEPVALRLPSTDAAHRWNLLGRLSPFERGELDGFQAAPGSPAMDHLSFVEPIDRLGQSVVIAVTDAADLRLDAGLRQPLAVFDGQVCEPLVRVADETASGPPLVQCLRECMKNGACAR